MNIKLSLTDKELEIVQLFVPDKSVEEIINTMIRAWFNASVSALHEQIKSTEQKVDELINKHAEETVNSAKLDKAVVT